MAGSIRSGRVIDVFGQLVSLHGAPRYLRSDNGPEFIATALLRWLQTAKIDTAFIDPGKPWQNGTDESFNGKFRNECLSLEWFRNRMEAKIGIERWRRHYNEERPHMSLGDLTPRRVQGADRDDSQVVRREPNGRHSPVITGPKKPSMSGPYVFLADVRIATETTSTDGVGSVLEAHVG